MMSDNENSLIEQYLAGKLTGQELAGFETRLAEDIEFAEEVRLLSDLLKGIKLAGRKDLKEQINAVASAFHDAPPKKKVSLGKVLSIAASVILITTIGTLAYYKLSWREFPAEVINKQAAAFPSVDLRPEKHRIARGKASFIHLTSGEYLSVPAETFTGERGNPAKGSVVLATRSLTSPFDQFVGGIPTACDSSGNTLILKPATLLKLNFFAGSSLKISHSAPIKIIVPVTDTLSDYRIYKLDTLQKRWIVYGSPTILDLKKYIPPDIVKPKLEDKTKHRFKIMIDEKQLPELAAYKNVIFEIAPGEKNYDPNDQNYLWNKITVQKGKPGEPYTVSMKNNEKAVAYKAIPVFSREDFPQAQKIYEARVKKYIVAAYGKSELKNYESAAKLLSALSGTAKTKLFSVFPVTEPGVYANSALLQLNNYATHNVSFEDETGRKLKITQLAIIDLNSGVLIRQMAGNRVKLSFDNRENRALLAVTSGKKLAYLTPAEFEMITGKQQIIRLNTTVINNKNYPKLKRLFGSKGIAMVTSFLNHP